jgi:membrane-associated protease RseP (regulator of RpoE activity)
LSSGEYLPQVPESAPIARTPSPVEPPQVAYVWLPPARPKFQHQYWKHLLFFVLTLATTTFVGATRTIWDGFWYSLPLLTILGAHEFGHYVMCRRYNVDATLPFFLPLPLPPTGTLGAVIRIREAFPSKQALFDIGVGGPIAGFVTLLPFLWFGIQMSQVLPSGAPDGSIHLGDPLIVQAVSWLHFGTLPPGHDVFVHPMAFAAWWGLLATALNLMPFGQLDGGHIIYALIGRRAAWVSVGTLAVVASLTLFSYSWISMTIMLLAMTFFLGVRHPRIVDEDTPLDARRRWVAFCALVIFVVSFTPVPIETLIK